MSDPVSTARAARENLARGLSALQSPGVPAHLMSVAEPVAHAMSALHRIETTHGAALAEAGPAALNATRQALATLQTSAGQHPAVDHALEALAGSLSLVHQLAQAAAQPAARAGAVSAYAGTMVAPQVHPPMSSGPKTQPSQASPYAARPEPQPQVAYAQAPAAPAWQPPPPQAAPAYQAAPAPQPWQPPAPQAAPAPAFHAQPAAPRPAAAGASLRVEAELGAHSATNFYKGLSGNDVIDSGGIFIATYQIPDIGQELMIKVSMPGGYEFEAVGVVRWTREAPNSGSDSSPGFGAQFTQISPEGRQLVYRYVRNREPLFHDDL
jgi:hypothetical protein